MKVSLVSDPVFDQGLGHLSRLIAIGQELNEKGDNYCFHPLSSMSRKQKDFIASNSLVSDCSCEEEPSISIVDTYNQAYISGLSKSDTGLVVQLADEVTPLGDCDGIIDVSPNRDSREYPNEIARLKFTNAPLFRNEIYSLKTQPRVSEKKRSYGILILGGVADSVYIETLTHLKPVMDGMFEKLTIGTSSNLVIDFAQSLGISNWFPSQELTRIYHNFGYVISGAGVTAWELAYLMVPGFVVSVAENQEFQLNYLSANNFRVGASLKSKSIREDLRGCVRSMKTVSFTIPNGNGRQICYNFLKDLEQEQLIK